MQQMESTYSDAWKAAKAAGRASSYVANCDGCTHDYRIDYVFTSRTATFLTVQSAEVVDTRDADGVRPSDHRPLLVTYSVK
jgi:endonuclease/exonuclease/phosphatase family metal-dependent hydrolase